MTPDQGWVAVRQKAVTRVVHTERGCYKLEQAGTVREATADELEELGTCADCSGTVNHVGEGSHYESLLAAAKQRGEKA